MLSVQTKNFHYCVCNLCSSLNVKVIRRCRINSICQEYHYQIFISVSPNRSACVPCMPERIHRKQSTTRRVGLNGYSIPTKSSPICIGEPVFSLIESLNCGGLIYSRAISMKAFVEVNLHISLQVLNNREKSSMSSYSFKQVGCWVMNLASDKFFSETFIDQLILLYSAGAIRQSNY